MKLKNLEKMIKRKYILISIVVSIIIFLVGIACGVFIKNIPHVAYKNEISLLEALTFLVTLGIGVVFPFLIKRWIDDKNSIKSYLIHEIEILETILQQNMEIIGKCYKKKAILLEDRDNVNFTFFNADLQKESIENQFQISFPNNMNLVESLKQSNMKYYTFLTGGEFMVSDFNIDSRFYREHTTNFNRMIMKLKELIHEIHKI